jgi:hypothetical protein
MSVRASLTLVAGTAITMSSLAAYDEARERFDRAAIQATSTGCLERIACPTPVLDTVPAVILAGLGIALFTIAIGAILFAPFFGAADRR